MVNPGFIGVSVKDAKNRGNVIHAQAARRLLPKGEELKYVKPWTDEDLEIVRSKSHLVVVMANAISLGVEESPMSAVHAVMADNIERANMPTVVLGLGSQAALGASPKQSMPKGTLRLLNALSHHSRSIACRGPFTVDVLKHHGIDNAEAIGCQSVYWHGDQIPFDFGRRTDSEAYAFNYSIVRAEADIIEWGVQSSFDLIGQTEFWEEMVIDKKNPEVTKKQEYLFGNTSITEEEYRAYCINHFKRFITAEPWIDYMGRYALSFGTRFHGNMAAWIAGVPSLWLVHDQRTAELCELLGLPNVALGEAIDNLNIEFLSERAEYSTLFKKYDENLNRFKEYLSRAGLSFALN